ncbi:hypothetical protein EUGRSUZ_A02732 [Eucalyptus grandis]|uniref:Uncharacterized protein n=2 Tax=Eucalyptus grandis TaxID=71139 RepID=A0ACC3M731_EUCGR|nr:hypothetical protein EUGRSUZ_A02732 [Eucalyptus grandis]
MVTRKQWCGRPPIVRIVVMWVSVGLRRAEAIVMIIIGSGMVAMVQIIIGIMVIAVIQIIIGINVIAVICIIIEIRVVAVVRIVMVTGVTLPL